MTFEHRQIHIPFCPFFFQISKSMDEWTLELLSRSEIDTWVLASDGMWVRQYQPDDEYEDEDDTEDNQFFTTEALYCSIMDLVSECIDDDDDYTLAELEIAKLFSHFSLEHV